MRRLALCLLAALTGAVLAQERAVVFDFQPVGIDTPTAQLASMLLRERLGDIGAFSLVSPASGRPVYTVEEQAAAARSLLVDKAVGGSLTRIGAKVIISYRLIDVSQSKVEMSDRATIKQVEELDLAMERIALALKERKPFGGTGEVGRLTGGELQGRAGTGSVLLTTGYAFPLAHGMTYDPGTMLFTLDASVAYETPDILATGTMGFRRGESDYNEVYFDLLVHKLFSKYDVSPYVGGGIGVHKMGQYGLDDDGMAIIGSGGLILFRTQYFRLVGGLKASLVITEEYPALFTAFNFGISSPNIGQDTDMGASSSVVYGCLGAFLLTGLVVALAS